MRFLRVIDSMNPASGGPCQGIRNSIPALMERGIYTEVVSSDAPDCDFIKNDCFLLHALGPANNPWSYNKDLIPWLLKNYHRFDVIIVHGLWLYHGFAVSKFYQKIRKNKTNLPKLFVMPHGMLDPYFQLASNRKLKAIRNWFYWYLIEAKLVNQSDGLLFTCEQELLLARKTFARYHPRNEINVGYGIISPPPFLPEMKAAFNNFCPNLKNNNYILFLSRIHEKKGVDLLIIAYSNWFKKNKKKIGRIPRLVVAGPGINSKYGSKIKRLVKKNQVESHIEFPGMLDGNAKWGAFYGAEAFFLLSHQENFGIAVVEALACGKPVLISDQVNIWREISMGEGGIVEKDTLEGAENLFEKWGGLSPDEKNKISLSAKTLYQNRYSIEIAAKRFVQGVTGNSTDN